VVLKATEGVADLTDDGQRQIRFHKPVLYQSDEAGRKPFEGGFVVSANNEVTFRTGSYDRSRGLTIDPVLVYSSYLGGSSQQSYPLGVALNAFNEIYITGITNAVNYPTTAGVIFPSCPPDDIVKPD
jgi:hypothetical protein